MKTGASNQPKLFEIKRTDVISYDPIVLGHLANIIFLKVPGCWGGQQERPGSALYAMRVAFCNAICPANSGPEVAISSLKVGEAIGTEGPVAFLELG